MEPALFKRLAKRGIAVITWHQGFNGPDWPIDRFETVTVPIRGPVVSKPTPVKLAAEVITLSNGLRVRQVRRLCETGRQAALITTDLHRPLEQIAGALFSRWAQENCFKSRKYEFNLDALPVHGLEAVDPEAIVINPVWRRLNHKITALKRSLGTVRNRLADRKRHPHTQSANRSKETPEAKQERLATELAAVKQNLKNTPKQVKVGELNEADKIDALPVKERLFLEIIRMICYRAETRMMPIIQPTLDGNELSRRLLKSLFTADADLIPEPDNGLLRVRILGIAHNRTDALVTALFEELNKTKTIFPGTNLQLSYELPNSACNPSKPASV
ncbi:MAG: hypothetical protein OXD38_14740 [Aestuariivita sp.]|nr:hypothetical protein [Aestuariivita sp.]